MGICVYCLGYFYAINRILSLEEYKQQILQQFVFHLCRIANTYTTNRKYYDSTKNTIA